MPQSLHYPIITILLLGSRAHQRRCIYNSLPLFRRTLLLPTGAIPLTDLVRQNIYNVWLSLINLSTVTGLPPRVRWCDRLVASEREGRRVTETETEKESETNSVHKRKSKAERARARARERERERERRLRANACPRTGDQGERREACTLAQEQWRSGGQERKGLLPLGHSKDQDLG